MGEIRIFWILEFGTSILKNGSRYSIENFRAYSYTIEQQNGVSVLQNIAWCLRYKVSKIKDLNFFDFWPKKLQFWFLWLHISHTRQNVTKLRHQILSSILVESTLKFLEDYLKPFLKILIFKFLNSKKGVFHQKQPYFLYLEFLDVKLLKLWKHSSQSFRKYILSWA